MTALLKFNQFDLTNLTSTYLPRYVSGKDTFEIPISVFSVAVKVIESLCWSDSFLLTRLQKNVNSFYYEKKSSCRGLPREEFSASINENAAQCACGCPIASKFYACCVCQLQIHERTRYPPPSPPPPTTHTLAKWKLEVWSWHTARLASSVNYKGLSVVVFN